MERQSPSVRLVQSWAAAGADKRLRSDSCWLRSGNCKQRRPRWRHFGHGRISDIVSAEGCETDNERYDLGPSKPGHVHLSPEFGECAW